MTYTRYGKKEIPAFAGMTTNLCAGMTSFFDWDNKFFLTVIPLQNGILSGPNNNKKTGANAPALTNHAVNQPLISQTGYMSFR